jgi:hypothetical protein
MKKIIFSIIIATTVFTSCKKDTATTSEYNTAQKGLISVEFDNIVGSADLQLNTGSYTNSSSETYKITTLKYYVSNFKFTNTDGTVYTVPQDSSYFLIDENDANRHEAEMHIPEGEYKSVTFTLGVDSLRNTMDISKRTGDLDPTGTASQMYWDWNSGYIHFKLEGTSPVVSGMMGNVFMYHVGGFGGYSSPTANNSKTIALDLSARGIAKVKASKTAGVNVHTMVDISKVFTGTNTISLATTNMVHSIAAAVPIAANLSAMFSHDHTEN